MGRRSRRRERAPQRPSPRVPGASKPGGPSRSERRDAEARAALQPLESGDRPLAVTIAAVVAALLAGGEVVAFFLAGGIHGSHPAIASALVVAMLAAAAWGMWRCRYWAVLGMQALLGLTLLSAALALFLRAGTVTDFLFGGLIVLGAGALFWFLVKAMARIQMPQRHG